ncbi:hypothetical protein BH23ACT5_BH23ACT5_14430 [soil metagenome]
MSVLWGAVIAATVAALLTVPANWAIKWLLVHVRAMETGGSVGAGRWIGILERLLIYVLILGDEAGAAGLVAAAKAILRFPEITGEEPHLGAEYVLVGSLASWTLAVTGGVAVRAAFRLG